MTTSTVPAGYFTWTEPRYSTTNLRAAGRSTGISVSFSTSRHEDGLMWQVRSTLPGGKPRVDRFATKSEAQRAAERFWLAWVAAFGLTVVEEG